MRDGHVDEKGEQLTVRYEYDGGIADFVKHLNSTRGETHKSTTGSPRAAPAPRTILQYYTRSVDKNIKGGIML